MELVLAILTIIFSVFLIICCTVGIFALYYIFRFELACVNSWREDQGKEPFSDRLCFIFALFTALAFMV